MPVKILAPVNSLASARFQIESGADELYVGLKVPFLKKISFGGRSDMAWGTRHVLPDEEEFLAILTLAHSHKAQVFFTANTLFLPEGESNKWIAHYLTQVEWVAAKGVDGVIIGDIGSALLLRQHGLKVPLIASNFFDPINKATLSFLADLGFARVTLPYQSKLDDILEFAKAGIVDLEVFGNSGCSLFDGLCGFKPHGNKINDVEIDDVGTPCQNFYTVFREGTLIDPSVRCFSEARYCSICSLPQLMEAGIAGIKLIGRVGIIEKFAPVTRVFRKAISCLNKGYSRDEIKREILPFWWKSKYCANQRCKYGNEQSY